MEGQISSLFEVAIPFETSHLFFPKIISYITLALLCLILLIRAKKVFPAIGMTLQSVVSSRRSFDGRLLLGSLILMAAYFYAMPFVGNYFPNLGLGFLICSIPFLFAMSLMYVGKKDKKVMAIISINSIIAPALAWFVLAKLFNITLP